MICMGDNVHMTYPKIFTVVVKMTYVDEKSDVCCVSR